MYEFHIDVKNACDQQFWRHPRYVNSVDSVEDCLFCMFCRVIVICNKKSIDQPIVECSRCLLCVHEHFVDDNFGMQSSVLRECV